MSESSGDWVVRGKAIRGLIKELQTFADQDCHVQISMDGGFTSQPISLVADDGFRCILINMGNTSG